MTTFSSEISVQEGNKVAVRRLFEELAQGNIAILDELVAEDYEQHSILGVPPGREGVRSFFEAFTRSFPDLRIEVREAVAEGDRVFIRAITSGTWKGEWMGMAANGKRFEIAEFDEFRMKEGMLVEHWDALDTGKMARDLGLQPP
jgi:steroid delta-isomerase-like uncharacterized protein